MPVQPIVINGRFLSQPITGVQRYAFELLRSLDHLLATKAIEPIPVTVAVPPNATCSIPYSFMQIREVGRLTGHLWEQCDLPLFARGHLLFTPCGGAPVLHNSHVITIHDAGPFRTPQAYTPLYRNYYKAMQRYLTRTAPYILTVSEFSKHELMDALRLSGDRISVTHLSGEHILRCNQDLSILARHGLEKNGYIFAVGSKNPNKNLAGLVEACALLPPSEIQIAVAGGANKAIFGNSRLPANPIKDLGFVNDSELRSLYENAACFVFPSFYEGFGLPPLEALAVGCPVIVSQAASLPEIFGSAATYCDPHSPQDIANKIVQLLGGEHPGWDTNLKYAAKFTWDRCARITWSTLLTVAHP